MAALSHFLTFVSVYSHKPSSLPLPFPSVSTDHSLLYPFHYRHWQPTISASSNKKPRASRKVKSNSDLCNDIREFVAAVGLPEAHVPSLKELTYHGRQDLANIVRRRGYKLIKEILANSTKSDGKGSNAEEKLIEKLDINAESTGQDEKVEDMAEDAFSSHEVSVKDNHLNGANGANIDCAFSSDSRSSMAIESLANSSLQEKVAKFIQNGELDSIEDDGFSILNKIDTDGVKGSVGLENVRKESSSPGEDHSEWLLGRNNTDKMLNGSTSASKQVVLPASGDSTPRIICRDDYFSSEGPPNADYNEKLDDEARKRKNQIEVDRLKFMLHQKELELSHLKEQIEKEKLALSILQNKAEAEMSKVQKLILEKDTELHAAEDSLSGLEEVQIQYWGDGETVEVAGSFNGWHQQITMDPQPASSSLEPIGLRKSRLWTAVLWLYPGIYEIKFIVDGNWRIDPQRESVTSGTIQNNILRVER